MVVMPIERGKIREYAVATANVRDEYLLAEHPPIPPTFLASVAFWDPLIDIFDTPEAQAQLRGAGLAVDVTRLLSLEQEYVFHGPLPRAGDVLTVRRRLDGATLKRGRRGGDMVLMRFALEFFAGDQVCAEARYVSAFLSGPTPAPPGRGQSTPLPATSLPERWFGPLTLTDIVRYQGASGDLNPMHHDDELARSAGYPAAFGVGMMGAGYLATYATDLFGTEDVRRFRSRFHDLMWRGDRLRAGGSLTREVVRGGERHVELALALHTGSGELAVQSTAEFVNRLE
jgi:acyl dehydratase